MTASKVNYSPADIQFSQLPKSWPMDVRLDWLSKDEGIQETANVANEANETAFGEKERNDIQDKEISKNSISISNANQRIAEVSSVASSNKKKIETHISSKSEHGVLGNNVGTENFAGDLVGGVVLISSSVDQLTQSSIVVSDAPANYDQNHEQSIVDAVRSLASKQNDIISKINEIIQKQKDAKQMS